MIIVVVRSQVVEIDHVRVDPTTPCADLKVDEHAGSVRLTLAQTRIYGIACRTRPTAGRRSDVGHTKPCRRTRRYIHPQEIARRRLPASS